MSLEARRRRKRLSMTSLIDVIFLLLLFFMLSSTFSRFAEVELQVVGTGGAAPEPDRIRFLRITASGLTLNGQPLDANGLARALRSDEGPVTLLVSVTDGATAQALTDVLVALRAFPNLAVSVLEAT